MARPVRNSVDYFPHLIDGGAKMHFIENKYGNDGYATWYKILEKLAKTDLHFLNLNKEEELLFLSSDCRITESKLIDIINDLVKIGAFNKSAWLKKIVWSDKFIENIQDAYARRNNKCIDFDGLCIHLRGLGIHLPSLCIQNDNINTHSIVEYSILDNSKVDDNVYNINSLVENVIETLNLKANVNFKTKADKNKKPIQARIKDGFKIEDFYDVIDHKVKIWGPDQKMKEYLRPETLFGTKFESYLNAARSADIKPISRFEKSTQEISEGIELIKKMHENGTIS